MRAGALDAGAAGSWALDMFVPAAMASTRASVVPVSRLFFASMTRWLLGNGEGPRNDRPAAISGGGFSQKIHPLSVRAKEVQPRVMAQGRGRRNAASRQWQRRQRSQVPAIGAAAGDEARDEVSQMQMAGRNPAIAPFMGSFHCIRSIQRFDLNDGGAVIVADPEHGLPSVVLHAAAPDAGRMR